MDPTIREFNFGDGVVKEFRVLSTERHYMAIGMTREISSVLTEEGIPRKIEVILDDIDHDCRARFIE